MARRQYKGGAVSSTITGGISSGDASLTLSGTVTTWPTTSFSFVIDPGLAAEEKCLGTRSGNTVTITTRGYDDTTAAAHNAGAVIYPVPTAIDFDEANNLVSSIGAGTGIPMPGSSSGSTLLKSSAAAGSATVTIPATTGTLISAESTAAATGKTTPVDADVIPISDSAASSVLKSLTWANIKATLETYFNSAVQTLTNKTLTDPKINLAVNNQTGTTYTLVLTDNNKTITFNNAAAIAVTIPTNASVAFPVGAQVVFAWITGAGQPTISGSGGVTIKSRGGTATAPKLYAANAMATAIQIATDVWLIGGDIS